MGNSWNISIKDYMGRVGDGILVSVSLVYDSKAYETTYWYNETLRVVTISDNLKTILGVSDIEEHSDYDSLVSKLERIAIPYDQIINSIDELDLYKYIPQEYFMGQDVDDTQISFATQSNDTKN